MAKAFNECNVCRFLPLPSILLAASSRGHTALLPGEDLLVTHNLTQGHFQLHQFPGTPAEAISGVTSARRRTIQGIFAEEGKIVVCGSDHGMVYVIDMATQEISQKLSGSG